ncbi:hypothetical protein [Schaalia turicensis]|nr:hypothetical protein [Schaalia turicensis]
MKTLKWACEWSRLVGDSDRSSGFGDEAHDLSGSLVEFSKRNHRFVAS